MDNQLLHSLSCTTLALLLVLLVRRPWCRLFGAGPSFCLWLLPALAAALPWLPSLPTPWSILPTLQVFPHVLDHHALDTASSSSASLLRWLWLAGATLMVSRLATHYFQLRRQSRPVPADMAAVLRPVLNDFASARLRLHPAGPALLWGPRCLLLLPADFLTRHSATERRLVLRHELTHLRRGDSWWNLAAELACALLWFHPLTWLARARFRLDQELACDEAVLRDTPQDEAGYARTLLHSAGLSPAPALIPWLSAPQLKERLSMIQRHRPGALRRRSGSLLLAAFMAGSVFVAQAASHEQAASQNLSFNAKQMPHYPPAAIKGSEQGTVVLKVQVHADGSVGTITYDPGHSSTTSADLIAAATDAARRWHFNPQLKDGKAVEGYARVPVKFSLSELPGKVDKSDVEKQSTKYKKVG